MLSKAPFFLSVPVYLTLAYIAGILAWLKPEELWLWASIAIGTFCISLLGITVLTYRMWNAIQDGRARTTPRRAALLLLVPIFNLYWIFPAFWGYAKDANAFIARYTLPAHRLPSGLFLFMNICILGLFVPFAAIVLAPIVIGFSTIIIWMVIDVINVIYRHQNHIEPQKVV